MNPTIEEIQNMTPAQLRDLRAKQGKPTTSRNRATLVAACIKAAMPRTTKAAPADPPFAIGEPAEIADLLDTPAPDVKPPAKPRKERAANPSGHAPTSKAKAPKQARKAAPAKRTARQEHTPESVGIGKVMTHGMRTDPYDGHTAECKATKSGFHVEMVGPKGGRKDLGVHASLGAAAKATGQNANGATFWRIVPYPKHAKKD